MPCNYKEYHPKWKLISKLIRVNRACNRCEWCGIANKAVVKRTATGSYTKPSIAQWDLIHYRISAKQSNMTESLRYYGFTKVVLTVAHVDHDKTNNKFYNLAALCQRCHLNHDIKQHVANRKYGRNHKGKHQLKIEL